jgi:hypothetical protein
MCTPAASQEFDAVTRGNGTHVGRGTAVRRSGIDARPADFRDEGLEDAGRRADDQEPAGLFRSACESVRLPARDDQHLARADRPFLAGYLEVELTIADDERFLERRVAMLPRARPLRPDLLEYAVGSFGVAFGSLEGEIESPQLVAFSLGGSKMLRTPGLVHLVFP